MANINEEARIPVYLNDEEAKSALKNLQNEADKWRKKMYEAMSTGDPKGVKEAEREMKKAQKAANLLKKETFDVDKVLKNLSSASVTDLTKAKNKLRLEMKGLNRDSQEYINLKSKFDQIGAEMGKINGKVTQQRSIMSQLKDTASGLLPAFGFAAIAAAGVKAFNAIKGATDDLGTQWDIFMGGMQGATSEFWRTLATGDWSNFKTNMRDAIDIGREYQRVLDELESKQRAMTLAEADARKEILELEDITRNRSLTNEERMKAITRRIEIEEELQGKRMKIATETFENEEKVTLQQTRLSKERLMEVMKDMDSETKARAVAYNDALQQLKAYSAEAGAQLTQASGALHGKASAAEALANIRMKELEEVVNGASEATKVYAEAIAGTGKTTDEQLDKMVAAYAKMKDAEVSTIENTTRVRRHMFSILSEEQREADKEAVAAAKKREEEILGALDSAYKERQLVINNQYTAGELTDKEHKAKMWAAEMAFLEQRKALIEQMGRDTMAVELQLVNERLLQMQAMTSEMMGMRDEISSLFDKEMAGADKQTGNAITDSVNAQILAGKKALEEMKKNKDDEQKIVQERGKMYMDLASSVGDSFQDLLLNQEASFGDFLKNTLVMALDALEKVLVMSIAEATIKDIATKGPLGIATAMAKIVVMKAAFATAKAGIMSMGGKKDKKGFLGGGSTGDGNKYEVAGVVHKKEYVIPSEGTENPALKPFIDIIEMARRNNQLARLDLRSIVDVGKRGYSGGGSASGGSGASGTGVTAGTIGIGVDPEMKELLRQTIRANREMKEAADRLHREGTYTRLLGRDGFMEKEREYERMKGDVSL